MTHRTLTSLSVVSDRPCHAVAACQVAGRTVVVSGHDAGVVCVRELAGNLIVELPGPPGSSADVGVAVACGVCAGQPVVVTSTRVPNPSGGGYVETLRVWDLDGSVVRAERLREVEHAEHDTSGLVIGQSADRALVAAPDGQHVAVWDPGSDTWLRRWPAVAYEGFSGFAGLSLHGRTVVAVPHNGRVAGFDDHEWQGDVTLYDLAAGVPVRTWAPEDSHDLAQVAAMTLPDGRGLVAVLGARWLWTWWAEDGQDAYSPIEIPVASYGVALGLLGTTPIAVIHSSNDDAGSPADLARVYDLASGHPRAVVELPESAELLVTPDGTLLVAAGRGGLLAVHLAEFLPDVTGGAAG